MKAVIEAAEHDARALLALSKSLNETVPTLTIEGAPERVISAIESAHAEVLRAAHLVTSWVAIKRAIERNVGRVAR